MSRPRVAIIVPAHNRSDLLETTLQNIVTQDFEDYQAIIVDDGSSDNTPEVLADWCAREPRFRSIRFDTPRGACEARNTGLAMTDADYVCLLDSDDLVHPEKLKRQVDELDRDWECDATVCQMAHFEGDPNQAELLWNTFAGAEPPRRRFLGHDPVWGIHAPLWRREILQGIGGLDASLPVAQDYELHLRALLKGVRFSLRSELLCYCRRHSGPAISTSKTLPRLRVLMQIFQACEAQVAEDEISILATNFFWLARRGAISRDRGFLANATANATRYGLKVPFAVSAWLNLTAVTGRHRFLTWAMDWAKSNSIDWNSREDWYLSHRIVDEPNLERPTMPLNTFTPPSP